MLVESVNVGAPAPNPHKQARRTGIGKHPVQGPVTVRDPGPKRTGLGSGLVGDFIGDVVNHGGSDQAVYAFGREDLDDWQARLGRPLPNGFFGENLTTSGLDVNAALVGEQWSIGDTVVLQVSCPRIPCSTFRGWVGEVGWVKTFTAVARPGAYLRVVTPGTVHAGDRIEVRHRPEHTVTISLVFRACTTDPQLAGELLAAGADLDEETRAYVARKQAGPPA